MKRFLTMIVLIFFSLSLHIPAPVPAWAQEQGGGDPAGDGGNEGSEGGDQNRENKDGRPRGGVNEGVDVEAVRDDYNAETNSQHVDFDIVGREHGRGGWREREGHGGPERESNRGSDRGGVEGPSGHSERRGRSEYREYGGRGGEPGLRGSGSRGSSSSDRAYVDRSSNRSEFPSRNSRETGEKTGNEDAYDRGVDFVPEDVQDLLFGGQNRKITRPQWAQGDIGILQPRSPSAQTQTKLSRTKPNNPQSPPFPDLPDFLNLEKLLPVSDKTNEQQNQTRRPLNIRGKLPERFFGDKRFFKDPEEELGDSPVLIGPFEGVMHEDAPANWDDPEEAEKMIENLKNAQKEVRHSFPQRGHPTFDTYLEASEFMREFAEELLEQGLIPESFAFAGVAAYLFMEGAPEFFQMTLPFTPLGDLQDLAEAASGRELFTGRQLTTPERLVSLAAVIFGKASVYRAALNSKNKVLREAGKLAEDTEKIWERFPKDTPEVVRSLKTTGRLPDRFITKQQAEALGWRKGKDLSKVAPGKVIGGDRFYNKEGFLPEAPGRIWYEADLGYISGKRTTERLLYSSDGKIVLSADHFGKDWIEISDVLEIVE